MDDATKLLLADLILYVHFAFVAFVVVGLVAIYVGGFLSRPFARNRTFRIAHVASIGFVTLETLLGFACPLTVWEAELRGGWDGPHDRAFMARLIESILFIDNPPPLLLPSCYVAVLVLTLAAWKRFPPRKRPSTIDR